MTGNPFDERTRSWFREQIRDEYGMDSRDGKPFVIRELRILYEEIVDTADEGDSR